MAQSEKDEVKQYPGKADPGSSPSPSFGAAAQATPYPAGKSKNPFARGKKTGDGAAQDSEGGGAATEEAATDDTAVEAETAEVGDPEELLANAQAEVQEWKDKFMRLHAEWDTYRRRTAQQRASEKASATENLVEHLLPVIDDFERTIAYADKNGETGLLSGIQAVHSKLIGALQKEGVEILDPQGEAFHALECQAVSVREDKSMPEETVAEVLQKGYRMGKKVLRPAMVTVTTGGPKREAPKEEAD